MGFHSRLSYYNMKTLILGLGNPILSDDAVGLHVARILYKKVNNNKDIFLEEASVGGLNLLELITPYDKVILIDSIHTKKSKPGTLYKMTKDNFKYSERMKSPHEINFFEALALGEKIKMKLPGEIIIYAIEAENIYFFSEQMSKELEETIPEIVENIYKNEFIL